MKQLDIKLLEKTLKLMHKYKVDEVQCEEFTVKLSEHKAKTRKRYTKKSEVIATQEEADQEFLDHHTVPPMDNEPWNNIPDEALNKFTINGKL